MAAFFKEHAAAGAEAFASRFPGAFLLVRHKGVPPMVVHLPREEGFSVVAGSDEDVDLSFETDQTLEPKHATFAYHTGFRGWTVQDDGSSFGTEVGGERIPKGRPLMLQDRAVIKLGAGLTEVQFYLSATLWDRMSKAGITKTIKPRAAVEAPPAGAPAAAPVDPPAPPAGGAPASDVEKVE